ncbi:MAG: carboxypeptidase regulatory-like domain-containing protein [Acidobacteria bacterium]|nr:MAG: carboxypeptidase regulatory-like domain-containing protein [Acidobacteriota bacterium]
MAQETGEEEVMKRTSVVAVMLLFLVGLAFAGPADKAPAGRVVSGKVLDQNDNALPSAIVYLTNTRTRAVKTYIVGQDGSYRFPALSPNIDYELYAQINGHKSDTKTVSQFDNREQVFINLKIDTK